VITLRKYQADAVASAWDMFREFRRLLGVAATGAGKTVMFSDLARRVWDRGKRTLILADQIDLVDQAVRRVYDTTGLAAAVEQGDQRAHRSDAPIVVSTMQSMSRRLDLYPPDRFALVIADEADKSASASWQKTLAYFDPHAKVLGVTATPNRADRKDIMAYFQAKAFDIDLFDLIRAGYLARIKVQTVPLEIDIREVRQRGGDYDEEQLGTALEPYFREISRAVREHAAGRRALVFWPLIRTSQAFVETARSEGLKADHIDGTFDRKQRDGVHDRLRTGETSVVSNAQLLGRGFDGPWIDCVVNCRVTRHASTYRQLVGRGTRIWCPNGCAEACRCEDRKRDLLILDFLWQFERFNVTRAGDLIAKNRRQAAQLNAAVARQAEGPKDLELLDSEVAAEHERNLRAEFDANRARRGTIFDALEWAANMDIRDLIDFEPETAKDTRPVTEYQQRRLLKAGFALASVTGFGHAERIIAHLDERIRLKLATFKQVHYLRRFGHPDPMRVGFQEASQLLDGYFGRRKQ
jgi:superfamily II DNA or RNA helicase